jgi:hypothetical protein
VDEASLNIVFVQQRLGHVVHVREKLNKVVRLGGDEPFNRSHAVWLRNNDADFCASGVVYRDSRIPSVPVNIPVWSDCKKGIKVKGSGEWVPRAHIQKVD